MKRKRMLWLPLLALLLGGCSVDFDFGPTPKDSEGGGGGTTSQTGGAVSRDEANSRVTAAFTNSDIADATTYQQTTLQEVTDDTKEYVNDALKYHVVENTNSNVVVKATGLQTDDPVAKVTGELLEDMTEDGVETYKLIDNREFYYASEWIYYHNATRKRYGNPEEPFIDTEVKLKQHMGPTNGQQLAEGLEGFDLGDAPVPTMFIGSELDVLQQTANITATKNGRNITVIYSINKDAFIAMMESGLRGILFSEEMTSEERAEAEEFLQWYVALLEEVHDLREYKITIGADGNDHLTQVRADFELITTMVYEPSETYPEGYTQVGKLSGFLDMKPKFNEEFTITLPDFSDYEEGIIFE